MNYKINVFKIIIITYENDYLCDNVLLLSETEKVSDSTSSNKI